MLKTLDYSKIIFAKGIVCLNLCNNSKCFVIDGNQGTEQDRCSLVVERFPQGLRMHTPPNRTLIPTGEIIDVSAIEDVLAKMPMMKDATP